MLGEQWLKVDFRPVLSHVGRESWDQVACTLSHALSPATPKHHDECTSCRLLTVLGGAFLPLQCAHHARWENVANSLRAHCYVRALACMFICTTIDRATWLGEGVSRAAVRVGLPRGVRITPTKLDVCSPRAHCMRPKHTHIPISHRTNTNTTLSTGRHGLRGCVDGCCKGWRRREVCTELN